MGTYYHIAQKPHFLDRIELLGSEMHAIETKFSKKPYLLVDIDFNALGFAGALDCQCQRADVLGSFITKSDDIDGMLLKCAQKHHLHSPRFGAIVCRISDEIAYHEEIAKASFGV